MSEMTKLEKAHQDLEDAHNQVARAAQDVADNARHEYVDAGLYLVDKEEMDELKAAIKLWKEASSSFLEAATEEANNSG